MFLSPSPSQNAYSWSGTGEATLVNGSDFITRHNFQRSEDINDVKIKIMWGFFSPCKVFAYKILNTIELFPNNAIVQCYYIKVQQITLWQVKRLA